MRNAHDAMTRLLRWTSCVSHRTLFSITYHFSKGGGGEKIEVRTETTISTVSGNSPGILLLLVNRSHDIQAPAQFVPGVWQTVCSVVLPASAGANFSAAMAELAAEDASIIVLLAEGYDGRIIRAVFEAVCACFCVRACVECVVVCVRARVGVSCASVYF